MKIENKKLLQKQQKMVLLQQLYAPYTKCIMCPLGGMGRKNVVFGEGNVDSLLLFIGEAPGKYEDATGFTFQGKAGKFLDKVFEKTEINRNDVFITNIVKCRPPLNRKPLPLEMKTCKNLLLLHQIDIIQPKVLCTLGSAALEGLLDKKIKISEQRGIILPFFDKKIIPTYHPAYVMRNQNTLEAFINDINLAIKMTKMP